MSTDELITPLPYLMAFSSLHLLTFQRENKFKCNGGIFLHIDEIDINI